MAILIILGIVFSMPVYSLDNEELLTLADLGTLEWGIDGDVPVDEETLLQAKQIEAAKIHNQWASGVVVYP